MSTWKISKPAESEDPVREHPPLSAKADSPPKAPVNIEVLETDVEAEANCDPYNRTGHFCVPVFDKRDS